MYWPYLSRRVPSNRECRIATIESATGWLVFIGTVLILDQPEWFDAEVPILAFAALLALHGLATLVRADPARGVVLLTFGQRLGIVKRAPPLDERDLWLRYRAFTISYVLLFGLLAAIAVIEIGVGLSEFPRREGFGRLYIFPLWLAPILPSFVLPWLARDEQSAEEPVAQARYLAGDETMQGLRLYPRWVRTLASASHWVMWALIALAIVWLFHSTSLRH
jgi:hypothetical protein